ncbi:diguanylate cyclase [Turicibacter sanguinis]|uniref:diguanylate cyclase n=1 Tax=Turicibacter sanguinis TaxID=154288 RepID=UPI002330AE3F|nr:diguanylate cyclase [Turicibacter sanguinis]MDB8544631.1 diguanylate cyclase [Turicibacter sanguinis]
MDYIKKKLGFLLLAISIGIITLFIIGREKTNYHLEIIKRAIKENVVLDVEQLRQYSEKIEVKLSKDEMDYFTLGYMNEVESNEESAIANYHQVTELISEKTDPFVILYTTTYLAKQMMDTKRYQQALDYVMIGVNNIEIEDYNDHAKSVWELLLITINNDRGEHFTTQTLEEVLKYEKKLNEETLLYLISKQTPLYCLRHQYADAINAALKGIKLAEQQHDQATKMKILIELGNVFKILENYDAAKQVIQEALKMVVKDTDLSDNLKLYAYKNLAQISLMQEDYEQVIAYTGLMKEYESKVKSEIAIEYEILRYLIYAQVDIYYGHIDYAYQSLLKATELFKQDENYTVFEKDLYYLNTLGQLYYHQENYDEAIKTYHELLELSEKRESLGFQKESIAKLLAIYQELGRIDEYQLLTDKLIAFSDVQQNRIGNEYIFYAIQSHQNDLILQRTIQYRIINMSIFMVLGSIIIYGILKFVRLVSQNRKDHLTNLYNRRYFDKIYLALKKRKKGHYSIILFDIDDFKKINDRYGHDVGDAVLMSLAKTVKGELGKREYGFRYGGEEFVILSVDKSEEHVLALAESIREKVAKTIVSPNIQFTISLGIAHSRQHEFSLKTADENLYHSKAQGKNTITT